jgi:hypothetical protein
MKIRLETGGSSPFKPRAHEPFDVFIKIMVMLMCPSETLTINLCANPETNHRDCDRGLPSLAKPAEGFAKAGSIYNDNN